MRTPLVVLLSLALTVPALAACGDADGDAAESQATEEASMSSADAPTFEDADVQRVWSLMMDTLEVDGGWEDVRYLAFDWIVDRGEGEPLRRSHRWDVWEGRYRVEAPTEGGPMVALFDVDEPTEGERVWIGGEPVTDSARADSLARRAHAMFINDSYWLLMPYKWDDEGVSTEYLGRMEEWGETYEVVELTFEGVGLTPQNKYRAFVDPESGLMEIWQHYRNASDTVPAFTLGWTDWTRHGPIMLSFERPNREGESTIRFEDVEAARQVPEGAFEPPSPPGGGSTSGG